MVRIAPSILSADFTHITAEIDSIVDSGAHLVHLDIMDGHFVPNITFGPFIIKQLRPLTHLPFDAHLMIENPERYIGAFAEAGCDMITVHAETGYHLHRVLQQIRGLGKKAGVSVNPHFGLEWLPYVADSVDLVLVMTVNPGFGGQSYLKLPAQKIAELAEFRKKNNLAFEISVDGGINEQTALEAVALGADILVTGSSFFSKKPEDRAPFIASINRG